MLPKGKKGGVVSNTVFGVGMLVVAIIVIFVIIQTVFNADLFTDLSRSDNRINQTFRVNNTGVYIGNYTQTGANCVILHAITNATGGEIIPASNYTLTSLGCLLKFSGTQNDVYNNTLWNISSTTSYTYVSGEETTSTDMRTNMTKGVDNISSKIPTILLIVAVVLLFGALIVLVRNSNAMNIGGQSSL